MSGCCRSSGFARWRCAYRAYGGEMVRYLPGGAALTGPTGDGAMFARWRCAYRAYICSICRPGKRSATRRCSRQLQQLNTRRRARHQLLQIAHQLIASFL
ncbi:hypothetical protein AXA59_13840 [Enterobacter hormaechei]|nr:hypothetical protein AM401_21230 [Enterobacter cloacae complex sp.]AXO45746.1 hypothetical protein AXA59_13840 [Enterobacter hormaechei]